MLNKEFNLFSILFSEFPWCEDVRQKCVDDLVDYRVLANVIKKAIHPY